MCLFAEARAMRGMKHWQLDSPASTKDAVSEILELRHLDCAESVFDLMFNRSRAVVEGKIGWNVGMLKSTAGGTA